MITFFIFYGLIEASNAFYVYWLKSRNWFYLLTIVLWGLSFTFLGLIQLGQVIGFWRDFAYLFFGVTWLPMIFVPCADKIFRINKSAKIIRGIIFLIISASQFIVVFF